MAFLKLARLRARLEPVQATAPASAHIRRDRQRSGLRATWQRRTLTSTELFVTEQLKGNLAPGPGWADVPRHGWDITAEAGGDMSPPAFAVGRHGSSPLARRVALRIAMLSR